MTVLKNVTIVGKKEFVIQDMLVKIIIIPEFMLKIVTVKTGIMTLTKKIVKPVYILVKTVLVEVYVKLV